MHRQYETELDPGTAVGVSVPRPNDPSGDDEENGDDDPTHAPATSTSDEVEGYESEHDATFLASLGGYIYFNSESGDGEERFRDDVYVMRPDGSELRRLTTDSPTPDKAVDSVTRSLRTTQMGPLPAATRYLA